MNPAAKRITLVIAEVPDTVTSLWTLLKADSLDAAISALALREDIKEDYIRYSVGWWRKTDAASHRRGAQAVAAWAPAHDLDGVVWTNLKLGLEGEPKVVPTYAAVLKHFKNLVERGEHAATDEYVRKTPLQIMTPYRRQLQQDLGLDTLATFADRDAI